MLTDTQTLAQSTSPVEEDLEAIKVKKEILKLDLECRDLRSPLRFFSIGTTIITALVAMSGLSLQKQTYETKEQVAKQQSESLEKDIRDKQRQLKDVTTSLQRATSGSLALKAASIQLQSKVEEAKAQLGPKSASTPEATVVRDLFSSIQRDASQLSGGIQQQRHDLNVAIAQVRVSSAAGATTQAVPPDLSTNINNLFSTELSQRQQAYLAIVADWPNDERTAPALLMAIELRLNSGSDLTANDMVGIRNALDVLRYVNRKNFMKNSGAIKSTMGQVTKVPRAASNAVLQKTIKELEERMQRAEVKNN